MSDQERLDALEVEGLAMHTPEFERDIAETMAERKFPTQHEVLVALRSERRERIAARVLPALVGSADTNDYWKHHVARQAVDLADWLLIELDAAEARDREATK